MLYRSNKAARTALIGMFLVAGGCGPTVASKPAPAPSVAPRDFATGREALDLAIRKVPGAAQVLRMAVTFPRDNGRAEFWSIELLDPARPGQPYRVDIEAKRVVAVQDAQLIPEIVPASIDQVAVDSVEAVAVVEALDWVGPEDEVVLQSTAWVVGGPQLPEPARGKPSWATQVIKRSERGTELVGFAWVSSENGSVLGVCRIAQGVC